MTGLAAAAAAGAGFGAGAANTAGRAMAHIRVVQSADFICDDECVRSRCVYTKRVAEWKSQASVGKVNPYKVGMRRRTTAGGRAQVCVRSTLLAERSGRLHPRDEKEVWLWTWKIGQRDGESTEGMFAGWK